MLGACAKRFIDAENLNKQDAASIRAVELVNELGPIDAPTGDENMDRSIGLKASLNA